MESIAIEFKIYSFDELSESAKQKAINCALESNDFEFESEYVIEDSKELAALFGLDIEKIYYSGFCSQGDGACFEGRYKYKKGGLNAVKFYAPNDTELHDIVKELQKIQSKHFYKLVATTKQSGHYMHSGCMAVDVMLSDDQYRDIGESEDDITVALRNFADWIYNRLDREYDYINSDAVIIENIIESDYEFLKNGTIHNWNNN